MKKILFFIFGMILCTTALVAGYNKKKHRENKAKKIANPPYFTVVGSVKMADGIGKSSVEILQGIKGSVTANFVSTTKEPFDYTDVPDDIRKILKKNSSQFGKVVLYQDVIWRSNYEPWKIFKGPPGPNQIRIAYSMFESDKIPYEWTMILNTLFDAVAVPDKFLIDIYKKSGVTIPIFEVPLGLNLSSYLKQPLKTKRNSPMVFANFGSCSDRKNLITLVKAFSKAFGNRSDVQLKINSRYSEPDVKKQLKEEIQRLNLENVFFSELCFAAPAYLALFKSVDCYVTLSKGEGFSIQPREAMAMGIPVIATDTSAQKTICESQLVKTVSTPLLGPAIFWDNEMYGYYSECNVDEAAEAFLDMYENYDSYLEKAQEARNWAKKYDYENLRTIYLNLIKPKKILLGEENKITPDYLMTNSQELYEKYQNLQS